MVYHGNTTNIHKVLNTFNVLTHLMQFTMEEESENRIKFLHFAIQKTKIIYNSPYTGNPK